MKKILLLSTLAFIIQSQCIAQFDPTWANRFQTVLDSCSSAGNIRGASVGVFVPGQGMWTGVSGISFTGVPITADMRFGVASQTKSLIATLVMKLREQGVLSLDDHLYQWLPSFPNVDSTTTISQLLSHQSGIFDFLNDNWINLNDSIWADTARFWTPQEVLSTIGPPHFVPGHGYSYCNTNYLLLGMVIEAATGNSWVQNLHTFILDPLNLDSTFVGAFENPNGPVAHQWTNNNTTEMVNSPVTSLYSVMNAAAALFSTTSEMIQFYNALFSGGIIAGSSLAELMDYEPTSLYGYGINAAPVNYPYYYHTGSMMGYESTTTYDSKTKSFITILTNGGLTPLDFTPKVFFPLLNVLANEYPKQPDDAGILSIVKPRQNSCSGTISPLVSLINYGSNSLTAVTINYQIDGGVPATYSWSGNLSTGSSVIITLPVINPANGFHSFTSYTSSPNGSVEGYTHNDTAKSEFIVNINPAISAPLNEGFESPVFPPAGWVKSSVSALQWGRTSLSSFTGNSAAARANVNDINVGATYDLDVPMTDISILNNPALFFTHAYTNYPGRNDNLQVLISSDCGVTWQSLFNKGGNALRTIPTALYENFYPADSSQWKKDTVSLAAYTGEVLIRFRSTNGHGNNLFIDDVHIDDLPVGINEVAINNVNINAYPNPATDQITIEGFAVNSEIQISDITGKIVFKTAALHSQKLTVSTTDFAEGVYLVQIQTEKFIETKKVIISK